MISRAARHARARQARMMATYASPIEAVQKSDLAGAYAAFPQYMKEYEAAVVPEPELKDVKSGRFDKFLRLLGSNDGEDWTRFLAAAVVDLRNDDPEICQSATIINAMIFAALCEVMPAQAMGHHLMAVQIEGMFSFDNHGRPSADNPMGSIETMDKARKDRALAHDALFRSWYHGLFMGGRGAFDPVLKSTLDRIVEQHGETLKREGPEHEEVRRQAQFGIEDATRVVFPGSDPALRPPLTELPLLGIDASVEDFMDAIVAGRFYTFFALSPMTADLAKRTALFRRVELGEVSGSDAPSLEGPDWLTPGRVARSSAIALGMTMVQPVLQSLWVHASAVPDSPALDRLAELASRWSHHGKRTLVVQGSLPPALEPLALETKMESSDTPAWRVASEVPAAGQPLSAMERNPMGIRLVSMGPPVDAVMPYETTVGCMDNAEDVLSLATSRLAAQSFMSNSVRLGSTVSEYLSGEVQRLHAAVGGGDGGQADGESLVAAFGDDPGRDKGPPVEALLATSTDRQRWAVLTGTVGPGCIAAHHSAQLQQAGQAGDGAEHS